jgi:anhydro-N-acetylmuramic acid kinase
MTTISEVQYFIGLMSGTSVDGIDAAVIEITKHETKQQGINVKLLAFDNTPFPEHVRNQIFDLFNPAQATIDKVGLMNMWLGELYSQATLSILRKSGLQANQIAAIGSHGQTIYHAPEVQVKDGYALRYTVQIGEGAVIANRTGIPCVSDFRVADMAVGGQGAPLVPFTEYVLFAEKEKALMLQNIGGIGNITVLPKDSQVEDVFAFDTGPGNMIIDELVSQLYPPLKMDIGGKIGASGNIIEPLLAYMQQDEYYRLPLPKSTGREYFGKQYVAKLLTMMNEHQWRKEDVIATATYVTAWSILDSYERYIGSEFEIDRLIVAGGGSYNVTLINFLKQLFEKHNIEVLTQEDIGQNSDAKEAVAFAVLAYYTMLQMPNNVMTVTGASQPVVMGKVSWPTK